MADSVPFKFKFYPNPERTYLMLHTDPDFTTLSEQICVVSRYLPELFDERLQLPAVNRKRKDTL
jgi:hypothetical protein